MKGWRATVSCRLDCAIKMGLRVLYKTHERMGICKRNRPFKKQEPLPHKFEWIEMEIAKNREEYGLIKTDLSKQKIGDKKS